jgi:predicted Ser/Thr protein kinase
MTNPRSLAPEQPPAQPSEPTDGVRDEKTRARARVGATIKGKWKLDSVLGVGGMASVFAATHRNGSRAALKIMHMEFARDANIRERFLREGYVANRIDHPGRVIILDDDITEQDEPFLVMELLEGETAQQLWRRKERRVPVEEALWIASEVLATLEVFHAHGIVHRDLKPANIFITRENVVKILDFGVARMRGAPGEVTRAGTALGTPSFMAPEQARGVAEEVDGRADLFSVGATLYAMLSGQRLHQARSDSESFILAATQPAPSLARIAPFVPIEVIRLVDRSLAWSPRNRFPNALAMRKEVLRVLEAVRSGVATKSSSSPYVRRVTEDEAGVMSGEMAPPPPFDDVAPADDPGVVRLKGIFAKMDELLLAAEQGGWENVDTEAALRAAFQVVVEALNEAPNHLYVRVRPYAFIHRGQAVWEPGPALDDVPYNLFAAGLRGLQIMPGLAEEELRELCGVMLIEPGSELSPEDDIASVLWEMDLAHVRCDILDDFAEGDAADMETFYEETDDVESIAREGGAAANHLEAAAMPIETDTAAIEAARHAASVLALDPVAKKALGAQLSMSSEKWRERYGDVIADAFVNAARRGDPELVTSALCASAQELIQGRNFGLVFSMLEGLFKSLEAVAPRDEVAELRAALTRGMITPDTLRMMVLEAASASAPRDLMAGDRESSSLLGAGEHGSSPSLSLPSLSHRGESPSSPEGGLAARPISGAVSRQVGSGPRSPEPTTAPAPTPQSMSRGAESSAGSGPRSPGVSSSEPGFSGGRGSLFATSGHRLARSFGRHAPSTPPVDLNAVARGLSTILEVIGPSYLDTVLDVVGLTSHDGLRRALLRYIERSLPGQEELVLKRLLTLDADVARPILRSLAGAKTPGVYASLKRLAQGADPALRAEATACLAASPEALREELGQMAEAEEPEVRLAALRTLVGHGVKDAVPRLIKRAQDSAFHKLSQGERRELLAALYALDQARAEPVVIDILQKHGILVDEAAEQTRALAATLLGERARSMEALQAALSAMKRRWWNTQTLRERASAAAELIAARLGRRIGPNGEVL